jgi:MraZ protein
MEAGSQADEVRRPRGAMTSRVDDKGRLRLPTDLLRYWESIGARQLFVTSFDGLTARVYPLSLWEEAEKLLESAGEDANEGEDLLFTARIYGGDTDIDSQGRIMVPPALRREMGVENEPVHLMYMRGHVEVFGTRVHEARKQRADENRGAKLSKYVAKGLQ